jgi:riboflavin transporter FmnP
MKLQTSTPSVHSLTTTALLATMAAILMFFDFALPIFPSFIKMDFSEIPGLIATISMGLHAGVMVELIKNLVNLTHTQTGGIGEMASFLIGSALVIPTGLLYRRKQTRSGAVVASGVGVITMSTAAAFLNYFVLIPLYSDFIPINTIIAMYSEINPYANTLPRLILTSIVPFNILKGACVTAMSFMLYRKIPRVFLER